jgi:glycosyltransferase involved in cell wall biosynthesis
MYRRLEDMDGPYGVAARAPFSRIALLGNALPRRCGLATYTSHVFDALRARFPEMGVDHYAMNDADRTYDYPSSVTGTLRQEELDDYLDAAERIEASGAELLWVQHEFGIFGGAAGAHLLALVERLSIPVAVTLHTVLDRPAPAQRAVMDRLIRASARLVVMTETGRAILADGHDVPQRKLMVVPHGVPDRPYTPPDRVKARFGLQGRRVLLTFGLLSPNKGIETMIEAMPAILLDHPDTVYVIAGATHPHLLAREGERYREHLQDLAGRLGVAGNIRWIDSFLDQESLLDLIEAADLYVTPYLNLDQVTSGTLSYAVALGKPVVSTPYRHAAELIGPANGLLVEPGASGAFAAAIGRLLGDEALRFRMAHKAYALGRTMVWRRNVEDSMAGFAGWTAPLLLSGHPVRDRGAYAEAASAG